MGYYTYYTLTASPRPPGTAEQIPADILAALDIEVKKMDVFTEGEAVFGYSTYTKWYDWREDMSLLSKRFPELLFCLHGDGEDVEDLWDAWFLDGKCQLCPAEISYDDFDPLKLLTVESSPDADTGRYTYQAP